MLAITTRSKTNSNIVTDGNKHAGSMIGRMIWLVVKVLGWSVLSLLSMACTYQIIAAPPLHFIWEPLPHAGPSSVYVPGAGFAGFWYHLGHLQELDLENDKSYYCYSSGCLSLILAYLNASVHDVFDTCTNIQQRWLDGNLTKYEIVEHVVDELVSHDEYNQLKSFLPRLNILVTSVSTNKGEVSSKAEVAHDRDELLTLLIKTMFIPMVTGRSWALREGQEYYIDGGFSRALHPPCEHTITVPTTFDTTIHGLNPGFGKDKVFEFWQLGQQSATTAFVSLSSSS